jgi:hypothetical protein
MFTNGRTRGSFLATIRLQNTRKSIGSRLIKIKIEKKLRKNQLVQKQTVELTKKTRRLYSRFENTVGN